MRNTIGLWLSVALGGILFCGQGCSSEQSPPADSPTSSTSESSATPASKEEAPPAQPKIKTVDLKSLPATKGLSPPVDEGRIQVPLLVDWVVPPRSSQWLFRFQRDRKTAYPQILVTVDENAPADLQPLTKQNVAQFAATWQQQMDKKYDPDSFGEQATPIQLGSRYAAECLIYVASEQSKQEQLLVKLVENGRLYTLELRVLRGTLDGYRPAIYAVAARLQASTPGGEIEGPDFGFSSGGLETPAETEPK